MPVRPRLPRGMRDFLPADMLRREYVFGIAREVFERYGFEPLQTPALELNEILSGKYGEDAEQLIYHAQHPGGREALALRYDLTVPLARVVGQHQQHVNLPFKRYQLAPVWRAERPQRGRYREFIQCDADIVGVAAMSADAEVLGVAHDVLTQLGFPQFTMRVNNRKLLTAIGQSPACPTAAWATSGAASTSSTASAPRACARNWSGAASTRRPSRASWTSLPAREEKATHWRASNRPWANCRRRRPACASCAN